MTAKRQQLLPLVDAREADRAERYARIASLVATGKVATAARLFDAAGEREAQERAQEQTQ